MRTRRSRYFVGDFETTVYAGQTCTEVWASACVELFSENVEVFNSIEDQFNYFIKLDSNIICYFHNLKFDGSFWLDYLLLKKGYKQALTQDENGVESFLPPHEMPYKSIVYSISSMGQWYRIIIRVGRHYIELRDSLKLLPFSVKRIGNSFGTKHKKSSIEYEGFRYSGCKITDEEKEYIKNDVLVIKEAIEIMFTEGHKKLTIGSCCLSEYKNIIGNNAYNEYHPNIYTIDIDEKTYGAKTAGHYIKNSYRGGWCYVSKQRQKHVLTNGITLDVNSLYPSMMSSESNNNYPVGKPIFWSGNFIPDEALDPCNFYFIRIKTRFYLKKNKLPFIQIKNTLLYKANEMLETSDVRSTKDGEYYTQYIDINGNIKDARVTLTLTMTDFKLILDHYELVDFEILDGCYFKSAVGIFDEYIEKYKKIKLESKGAKRELAKLFLNNLYGKMASNTDSSFKIAYEKEGGLLGFYTVLDNKKTPGYIPVGSAITSYARNFTIRAAQANYKGFAYSDTDSIHVTLPKDQLSGIKIDEKAFCCWKLESEWDYGIFTRQKTYIEHITSEDGKKLDEPYYNIKCAGMPERCKALLNKSLLGIYPDETSSEQERAFLATKRTLKDFDIGLIVPGKLLPKRIPGGIVLSETTYEMR